MVDENNQIPQKIQDISSGAAFEEHPSVKLFEAAKKGCTTSVGGKNEKPERRTLQQIRGFCVKGTIAAVLLCALTMGGVCLLLERGPLNLDFLRPAIETALEQKFGRKYRFSLDQIHLARTGYRAAVDVSRLTIKDKPGQTLLMAPHAAVTIDLLPLIVGSIVPRQLEIFDVVLRLSLNEDGSLALNPGPESGSAVAISQPLAKALGKSDSNSAVEPHNGELRNGEPSAAPPPVGTGPRTLLVKQASAAIKLLINDLTDSASPAAAIDNVSIERGKLIIEDNLSQATETFDDLKLGFDRAEGGTHFILSARGPSSAFEVKGTASGAPGTPRVLGLTFSGLSLDELTLAAGRRNLGAEFDMPLSGEFSAGLNADGRLNEASGRLKFGSGFFRADDRDFEPMLIDEAGTRFHWDSPSRTIIVDDLHFLGGQSHFAGAGTVTPPMKEDDGFAIKLASLEPNVFGPERPGEMPIVISQMSLDSYLFLDTKRFVINRFAFSGANFGFATAGTIDWVSGPHIRLGASLSPSPVRTVARIWPAMLAAPVRAWFLAHFLGGTIEDATLQVDLDAATLDKMRYDIPPADDAVLLDLKISDGIVDYLKGVPPLTHVDGTGHVTGQRSNFKITSGLTETEAGHQLNITEGMFQVPDAALKPPPAIISARVSGSMEAVADLLQKDAFKPFAGLPADPSTLKGQIDGKFVFKLKIEPKIVPKDTSLEIAASATNFSAERLIGKEPFENATLSINVDSTGMKAQGQGKMYEAPASVDIQKPAGKAGEAKINLSFDDAARAKLGFGMPGLSGLVTAKVTVPLAANENSAADKSNPEKQRALVELDLSRAAFDNIVPGFIKPLGHPGHASFQVLLGDDKTTLDQISLEAGPVQVRGAVILGPEGQFNEGRFTSFKLSPGDDIKIDALRLGDSLKLILRGSTLDARPFLKRLIFAAPENDPVIAAANAAERKGTDTFNDVDLDMKVGLLTGHNKQILSGAEMRLEKRGPTVKQFSFSGHFGRDAIAGNLIPGTAAPRLNLTSEDAGSLLSFIDVYKHMANGRLDVSLQLGDDLSGLLTIRDFTLRDEPALRRLVTEETAQQRAASARKIDANSVAFQKLQVHFQRMGDRVNLASGTMYGDLVGLSVDGWLDYVHDRVDMKGTFVPLFALNNLFSQLPVVGPLLGGGSNEGLFALNFRVTGSPNAPSIAVNPLSVIAPGFLRQIFGVGEGLDLNPSQ